MNKLDVFDALTSYAHTWSRYPMSKEYLGEECRDPQARKAVVILPAISAEYVTPVTQHAEALPLQFDPEADFVFMRSRSHETPYALPLSTPVAGHREHFGRPLYARLPHHGRSVPLRNLPEIQDDPRVQYKESLAGMKDVLEAKFEHRKGIVRPQQQEGCHQPSTTTPDEHESVDTATQEELERSEDFWWTVLTNDNAPTEHRVDALNELLFRCPESVSRFVVYELCRDDVAGQWRNSLILAAETVQLEDQQLRGPLRERLYELASTLRHSTEAGIKPAAHSAIRCYASMIPASEAESLQTFLEPPYPVETRLVTLQCVVHLFEVKPPESAEPFQQLADRIYELADKFLDRDWLVAGEKAAIGQNATFALAAMGDPRLSHCIEAIRALDMNWLTRQMERKLDHLLRNWSADPDVSKHPATRLVQEQLVILRSQGSPC